MGEYQEFIYLCGIYDLEVRGSQESLPRENDMLLS